MNEKKNNEKPEVYALRQNENGWQISRRDFLKAAGIGAAAVGAGLGGGFLKVSSAEDDINSVCRSAAAHQQAVKQVVTTADGKWLISRSDESSGSTIKCWNFDTMVMNSKKKFGWPMVLRGTGFVGGDSTLTYTFEQHPERINYMTMKEPFLYKGDTHEIKLKNETITDIIIGKNGDIYAAGEGNKLFITERKGDSNKFNKTKTLEISETIEHCSLIDDGHTLFARFTSGECGLVALADGSITKFDVPSIIGFSVVPGGRFVLLLIGEDKRCSDCRLYSLQDGEMVWHYKLNDELTTSAVTPDGSMAIIVATPRIILLSIADGKEIAKKDAGINLITSSGIAVSGDGRKLVCTAEKAIIFYSIPELEIIGCPVDLKEMKDNTKGVEVQGTDALTGETVTYTLPCGAPLPAGAVCTCNCVAGRGGCSCNSHKTCSCNSHHTSYSYTYYYPN